MKRHILSTTDNPWNPWTHPDEWEVFDRDHRYHTQELVSRVVVFPYGASDRDQDLAIETAIQEIMAELGEIPNTDGEPFYKLVPEPTEALAG